MLAASLLIGLTACENAEVDEPEAEPVPATSDAWSYTQLDSATVRSLSLSEGASVALGTGGGKLPSGISQLLATPTSFTVIDDRAAAVNRYDRAGQLVFSLSASSDPPLTVSRPQAIASHRDSLVVASVFWAEGATFFGNRGELLGKTELLGNTERPRAQTTSPWSIALADSAIVFGQVTSTAQIDSGTARLVRLIAYDGTPIGRGCEPDPLYRTSLRRSGQFGQYRGVGARVLDSRIYCWQAISPIVQILNTRGDSISAIRIAPPFYRRGADAQQSMNQRAVERFSSRWTEHVDFFPFPTGFLSVYASFDLEAGERTYELFLCRDTESAEPSCAMSTTSSRPMAFIAPDTLVTVAYGESAGAPPSVRLVVVR